MNSQKTVQYDIISEWLQTTKEGRHLLMQITFPIANFFKTAPEKIPVELVVEIINTVVESRHKEQVDKSTYCNPSNFLYCTCLFPDWRKNDNKVYCGNCNLSKKE